MPVEKLAVDPVTADPDTTLRGLARTMDGEEVGDVIITQRREPVGIVTDRDIALAFARHGELSGLHADDVMTRDPVTIEADAEDVELPKRLEEASARRLPVVNGDGEIEGVVTLDDVVAVVGEEMSHVASVIEAQSPEYSPT